MREASATPASSPAMELLGSDPVDLGCAGARFLCQRWEGAKALPADATHYFFVARGLAEIQCDSGLFTVGSGMYGVLPGKAAITPRPSCAGLLISCCEYHGVFALGGPIERVGRLRYIDGCTDSLLAAPIQCGDPCLNYLHIPPGVHQTAHTHPSFRLGWVVRGRGVCRTEHGDLPLAPGDVFVIHAEGLHSFHTDSEELAVVAFHPDSDFGPTHEDHPMLNRTIVAGRSAATARREQERLS